MLPLTMPPGAERSGLAAVGQRIADRLDRRVRGDDPLRLLFFAGVVLLLVVLAVAVLTATGGPSRPSGKGRTPAKPATAPATAAARQEAAALNALLVQNDPNRALAQNGTQAISTCGDLATAISDLQQSSAARSGLVTQLGTLDLSALPGSAALVSSLRSAWQDSASADAAYARWGQDEANNGCTPDDHGNSNFQAAQAPDSQASAAKDEFVSLWNPLATAYGLPTWQPTAL